MEQTRNLRQSYLSKEFENLILLNDFINLRDKGREIHNAIFAYVKGLLKDYEAAEDVISEVQINAWHNRDSYNPNRKLESWLYAIAQNASWSYKRKNKRWRNALSLDENKTTLLDYDSFDSCLSPLEYLESLETQEQEITARKTVKECIEKLPIDLRQVINLVYYERLHYKNAAEKLGIPIGTLKSKINRSKEKLRELLKQNKKAA